MIDDVRGEGAETSCGVPTSCSAPTMDAWSWIARARAAAKRAVEPVAAPESVPGEAAQDSICPR